jgi:hypothetical protein
MSGADEVKVHYVVEALTPEGMVLRLPAVSLRAARFLGERMRTAGSMVTIIGAPN